MKVIVTAGPTREFLDAVRFLSNPSSGRMGFAVAEAAAQAGHEVTLVAGPVDLPTPEGVGRVDVVSARDMHREVTARFDDCDAVVMVAAVADYRPEHVQSGKIKKRRDDADGDTLTLTLVRNPDILAELGARKRGQVLIGFALETTLDQDEARRKLEDKRLDAIVLNTTDAFGSGRSAAAIITARDTRVGVDAPKAELAKRIVELLEEPAST